MKCLILLVLLASCASKVQFRPFRGASFVCKNPSKHTGCTRSKGHYDNIELHSHDPREIDSIEVPF